MAEMTAARINDLPDSAFAYIEPGGSKDDQGKTVPRSKRHFPIHDAAHVRNALARAPQSPFGDKAMPKIKRAARKFGIDVSDDDSSRTEFGGPQMFLRSYPLEDIRILSRAQGAEYADGRTVEAYIAVFDREAEIRDGQGHYREVVDRAAFNKAIADARPQGSREAWRTGVFYNHGMTLHGTPSDRFSVPLGSPVDIRVEDRGLLTVTRYNGTPLADEILEAIRSGDMTGHSFTGRMIRSNPTRPTPRWVPGRRQRPSVGPPDGARAPRVRADPVPCVHRHSSRRCPFHAGGISASVHDHHSRRRRTPRVRRPRRGCRGRRGVGRPFEPVDIDTPSDEGAVSDEPPHDDGHSSRDALLQRIAVAKTTRPGLAQSRSDEIRRTRTEAITSRKGSK